MPPGWGNFIKRCSNVGLTVLLLTVALVVPVQTVSAQSESTPAPIEIPENLTREQARDLVARLSDTQVRELIIRELDRNAVADDEASDAAVYFEQLRNGAETAWAALTGIFDSDRQLHALPAMIGRQISEKGRISNGYLWFQFIGLVLAGFIAERIARRALGKTGTDSGGKLPLRKRFSFAFLRGALGLVELGAFALGAILFIEISGQNTENANRLWYEVLWCLLSIKLVMLAVRLIAAPRDASVRLAPVSQSAVTRILAWTLVLSSVLILPQPILRLASDFGATRETLLLLNLVTGLVFIALLIALVIRLREYGAKLIAGEADSGLLRQNLARIWWLLTIVYIIAIWLMSIGRSAATGESSMSQGLGSLLLFAAIPYLDLGLRWLIRAYFEKPGAVTPAASVEAADTGAADTGGAAEEVAASDESSEFDSGYQATALGYARVLMLLALLAIFVRLWNIDIEAIAAQMVGERFAGALFDIGITVLLAWALWGVIRISIERKLEEERGTDSNLEEAEAGGLGGTRTETVLPLIRSFIKITLIIMTVMICLSALGVDIGPLIAGAGVVGLAIGFGAQTLVRDIVSGFFYLIDDAFRIGEYVIIDQIRGTVEKISLRSFQLRHHNGPVHTVPYGEIRTLTNTSRDWAIMKFELRIPYETDIEKVRKLIKKIGLEMMEDPVYGPLLLAPLKSQGVNRMDDSALIIRCKFTAVPGQQYLVRREAFTRIQKAFEAENITFAPRRVLVEATAPETAVKAAAAAIDRESETPGQAPQPDTP